MRAATLMVALCCVAVPAAGQRYWAAEIGIQGGFARLKFTGNPQADPIDFYDIPGSSFFGLVPTYGSLFMDVPVGRRLALEPSFRLSQYTAQFPQTSATLGLRVNWALTGGVYAGVGGLVSIISTSPTPGTSFSERQVGLQLAAGYRFPLGASLNGRVEAQTLVFRNTSTINPYNVYALTFGLSTPVSRAAPKHPRSSRGRWSHAIGVQAGYGWSHAVGGEGLATFSFPSIGAGELLGFGSTIAPAPPTLFAIIPLAGRLALDAGLDAHLERSGVFFINGGLFTAQFIPRLDVRVTDAWYAGAGPAFRFFRSPTVKLSVASGVTVAWGYRFPLTSSLGGRLEASYTMYKQHLTMGFRAVNALAISLGATFPL